MIYTLTVNPAVDVHVRADVPTPGAVNRSAEQVISAQGKGLNVSFVLRHFGVPSGILGFFGGFTGQYIVDACRAGGYPVYPVTVGGETRINFFAGCPDGEYKFVDRGPAVTEDEQEQLLSLLGGLTDLDCLTVNGSAARGQAPDFYDRVFEVCRKRGVPVVLDIDSAALPALLRHHPLLIKPNLEELGKNFGLYPEGEAEIADAMRVLHERGAQNILLTLGKDGMYGGDGSSLYFCPPCPVTERSSIGAGDSCLAGFLSRWLTDHDMPAAMKRGAAAGASAAECDGLGDFARVEEYESKLTVRKIR